MMGQAAPYAAAQTAPKFPIRQWGVKPTLSGDYQLKAARQGSAVCLKVRHASVPFPLRLLSEMVHRRSNDEKALSFHPTHSCMVRNIFRQSGLFLIKAKGGVRVIDDERVEVE
jgi:hypothetical protein